MTTTYPRHLFQTETVSAFTGRLLSTNPSGCGKDEMAYNVTYFLNRYIFLVKFESLLEGYVPQNLTKIAEAAKTHKVNNIIYESNFGDGIFG
ncbi:hypothetical protein [Candidatus Enterovibrio escicola]|uniref:hypothetical protein n=1 Tax=Candidatus Enterovibrio escicola TaxID=1927127 RepID=UPI00374480B2